jgi:hypothetical protein
MQNLAADDRLAPSTSLALAMGRGGAPAQRGRGPCWLRVPQRRIEGRGAAASPAHALAGV